MKLATAITALILAAVVWPIGAGANQAPSTADKPISGAKSNKLVGLERTESYRNLQIYVNDLAKKNRASAGQKRRWGQKVNSFYAAAKKEIAERSKIRRSDAWAKNRRGFRQAVRKAYRPYALEVRQINLEAQGEIIEIRTDYRQEARDFRREEWGGRVGKVKRAVRARIQRAKQRLSGQRLARFKKRARKPLRAIIARREQSVKSEVWPAYRNQIAAVRVQRDIEITAIKDEFNAGPRAELNAKWRAKFRKEALPVVQKATAAEEKKATELRDRGRKIISKL